MKRFSLMLAAVGLFWFASLALAQTDDRFARANDEFAKGDFQAAIKDYRALVDEGQWSAALFYNLGNAYFRTKDFGHAILNYERALELDPRQPEAAANLALARDESRALELQQTHWDSLLKRVSPNQLTVAAVVAFWIAMIAFAVRIITRRRSALTIAAAILALGVTLVSGLVVYRIESLRQPMAIVIAPDVQARLATADNASSVLQLPPGSEIRVLSQRGDWVYALLPNNLRGWIPTNRIEPVRI
jgi:tetratricopeptide (TPR) repeat protein